MVLLSVMSGRIDLVTKKEESKEKKDMKELKVKEQEIMKIMMWRSLSLYLTDVGQLILMWIELNQWN